ncbi:MAG TPA: hypothetical protein VFV99_30705 [Kofleriaceae bacterium]|nr:hypothetical protein [Kofleriaceae bacterium]
MRVLLAFVALLAGCKKEDKAAPAPSSPEVAPQPVTVAVADAAPPAEPARPAGDPARGTPCPTGSALREAVAKAFGIAKPEDVDTTCNEMRTPQPVWAIDANAFTGDLFEGSLALLDTHDQHIITKLSTGDSDQGLAKATITVADLDGDGIDELMRSATVGGHGFANETLHILIVRDNKLVEVGKLPVRSENTGAVAIGEVKSKEHYECQSTMKVIKGASGKQLIEIVGDKRKGKPPVEECPPVGRHVYAFDGKAVTETKAK